jgi:tRNA A-37 threonylcarbamoyl transferase component Bud32
VPRHEWGPEYKPGMVPLIMRPKRGQVNHKEELFAHWYVKTGSISEAYIEAGYVREDLPEAIKKKRMKSAPRRLFNKPAVQLRIKELMEADAQRLALTPENIADRFMKIYDRALETEDLSAANTALENVGKYLGMFIDKKMVLTKNISETPKNVEELDDKIGQLMHIMKAGLPAPKKEEAKIIDVEVTSAVDDRPDRNDSN